MAERYTRLSSLPENQYTIGSPILIAAGALLKDNQTGKALAQIKFKSISEKQIKAVKIAISAFDVSGKELEGVAEYQYLDLTAARTAEFGHKQAVTLPDAVTRSIEVKCTDVFFTDGTVWIAAPNAKWSPLPTQSTIEVQLGALAAQYKRDTSGKSRYIPIEHSDLWLCSCGAIIHDGESQCHNCRHCKADLFNALDTDTLRQRDTEFKAAAAEKAAKQAAANAVQRAKTTKFAIVAAVVITLVVSSLLLTTKVIIPNGKYNDAVALMDAGKYEEAIAAFEAIEGYKDSTTKIEECAVAILDSRYNDAVTHMNNREYEEAVILFESLSGYKDCESKIITCKNESLKIADVGNCVLFGKYEQDNNKSNGAETISWKVLAKEDDRILVISQHALECMAFHKTSDGLINWDECSLREWLNDDFMDIAFSSKEKPLICLTTVVAHRNIQYDQTSGRDTEDQVFLLSCIEADRYFGSDEERQCKPTQYVASTEPGCVGSNGYSYWWLRTDGSMHMNAALVSTKGSIYAAGLPKGQSLYTIRPAMWIDLGALG